MLAVNHHICETMAFHQYYEMKIAGIKFRSLWSNIESVDFWLYVYIFVLRIILLFNFDNTLVFMEIGNIVTYIMFFWVIIICCLCHDWLARLSEWWLVGTFIWVMIGWHVYLGDDWVEFDWHIYLDDDWLEYLFLSGKDWHLSSHFRIWPY